MSALLILSDHELLDLYQKATAIDVDQDFIELITEELKRRGLEEEKIG